MQHRPAWQLKFWRCPHLEDVEFLHASNVTHEYPPHMHEEYSIALMLRGTETTVCDGKSYEARPGDLLFINAEQVHASSSVNSGYRSFKISPDALARISMSDRNRVPRFTNPVVKDRMFFRNLLKLHINLEEEGPALEQESEFVSTMAFLLERHTKCPIESEASTKREDAKVRIVREYLRDHYAENVSLSQLTSLANLSPFYLLRVFHRRAGFPPHEYQTQVRIAHARQLIRKGTPLSQIAAETGFFDQSHLSRNFKRIVGVTPRQYFRA
jgi:AraC-like DNA-binding protein